MHRQSVRWARNGTDESTTGLIMRARKVKAAKNVSERSDDAEEDDDDDAEEDDDCDEQRQRKEKRARDGAVPTKEEMRELFESIAETTRVRGSDEEKIITFASLRAIVNDFGFFAWSDDEVSMMIDAFELKKGEELLVCAAASVDYEEKKTKEGKKTRKSKSDDRVVVVVGCNEKGFSEIVRRSGFRVKR